MGISWALLLLMDQKAKVLRCICLTKLAESFHSFLWSATQEIRIDDYLKAYRSTGRPPQPCPQQPEDESQRTTLNLPPLFKPQPIRNLTSATISSSLSPFGTVNRTGNSTDVQLDLAARITNPAELPPGQEFRLFSANGEKYHCITCMPEYTNFSQEVRFF